MKKAEFYIAPDTSLGVGQHPHDFIAFVCAVVRHNWRTRGGIDIAIAPSLAEPLSARLWFDRASFLPHTRSIATDQFSIIRLGSGEPTDLAHCDGVAGVDMSPYPFILDVVPSSESAKEQARARFRAYRSQGIAVRKATIL